MISDEIVLTLFHGLDARRQGEFVQLMQLANARRMGVPPQVVEPRPRPRLTLVRCGEDRAGSACTPPGYTVVTWGG